MTFVYRQRYRRVGVCSEASSHWLRSRSVSRSHVGFNVEAHAEQVQTLVWEGGNIARAAMYMAE